MENHVKYFDEHAEKMRIAGVLTAEMAGFYHDLFAYLQRYHDLYGNDPRLPALQQSDLPLTEQGNKIFSAESTRELLAGGLSPLIEIVASHNPGVDLRALGQALATDHGALNMVAEAVLNMDAERLEQFAISSKTGTDEAIFVVINWLKPFFISLREKHRDMISGKDDLRLCPFCGYRPDMAAIVTGIDGKRHLHCSLCGHQWQYRRIACAICGTEDAASLEYLSSEDDNRYRLDVCGACGGYMKTVRLEKFEDIDECDLAVENILTAHLDSAALKKGYKKP